MANTFPAFLASLEALKRRIADGAGDALKEWADDTLEAANASGVVPVDTGALRASGSVEGPLTGGGKSTIRLSYDVAYALQVHEAPQSARKTGRSKWLETTITSKAGELGPILKQMVGL